MRKTLVTLAATGALALGGLSAAPQPANAVAWWVAPAIVGGVIAGGAVGAAAANNYYAGPNAPGHYAYAPGYYVPPQPYDGYSARAEYMEPSCYWTRERVRGGWRRIRVCD
jgi:hypothetical protein